MKRHEQLLQAHFLDKEEAVIKRLRQVYGQSLKDATAKAEKLQKEFDDLAAVYDTIDDEAEKARLQSIMRSKVYQKKYQESLKGQMSDVLDKMHEKSYTTISQYLDECYTDGFVGAMQSLHKQGIPLAMPIDQKAMVRAVQLDSKISKGLYNHLGEDVAMLKKRITAEVSRGISSGLTHEQVASNLAARMTGKYENPGGSMAYAMRIARTEGHRIQCEATFDAMVAAKAKGADIVKQWDSTLDGRTRESHQRLDGEIREVEEKFSNGLLYPGDSSGKAAEVIHCRCVLMQRARAGLDDGEFTKMNNFTKQLETFESPDSYAEFKKGFFSKENVRYMNYVSDMEKKHGTRNFAKVLGSMSTMEYNHYSKLLAGNPVFNKTAATASAASVATSGIQDAMNTISGADITNVLTNTGDSGTMSLDIQLFAEKDIKRQESSSLKRAIRKYKQRIEEHKQKIANPAAFVDDWENVDDRKQAGLIKHWKKEINNFQTSIDDRIAELKARGDFDE